MQTSQIASRRMLETIALISILLVALYLRLRGLGDLGLWIDEDLTWIAGHSLARDGAPTLPSGEVYARGVTYTYVVATFVNWFGSSPTILRLPSVIFSLLGLVMVYFLARRMGGSMAGILAAAILAVSPWDFHYAQMARMYALFGFIFTAGVLWAYRGSVDRHLPSRIGAILAVLLAVPTHQLGATLAWIFLLPFFFSGRRSSWRFTAAGLGSLGFAMWGYRTLKAALRSAHQTDLKQELIFRSDTTTFDIPFVPSSATLNYSSWLLRDYGSESTVIGAIVTCLLLTVVGIFLYRRRGEQHNTLAWLCCLAFVILLLLNQLVLASLAALYLLAATKHPAPSPMTERSFFGGLGRLVFDLIATIVLVTGILLLGRLLISGMDGLLDRRFLRLFFALPVPFYRLLILQFPGMAAVVFLGGLITFVRGLRPKADITRSFIYLTFVTLLVMMGLFISPYVINRYNFYLNGLFVALFAVLLTDSVRFFTAELSRRALWPGQSAVIREDVGAEPRRNPWSSLAVGSRNNILCLGVLVAATLILCEQFDPRQTWAASQRSYGYNRETLTDADLISHFRYDYETAVRFIEDHRAEGDLVAAKEPAELVPYGLYCDYRINEVYGVYATNDAGEILDWYIGIPFLKTLSELQDQIGIAHDRGHAFWVTYPRQVEGGPAVHLPEDIQRFLAAAPAAFTSRDGVTVVLKL